MDKRNILLIIFFSLFLASSSGGSFEGENEILVLSGDPQFVTEPNGTVGVEVGPLDPQEEEESARIEEEALEEEIAQDEKELEEIVKAEKEFEEELQETTPTQDPIKMREQIKAQAVENLMQIFGLTSSQLKENKHGPPPEFMIDLYNTITDSSGVTRAKNPYGAHVVRSFLEKDNNNSSVNEFFFFNLTSQLQGGTNESVLEAELHLFRMDIPRAELHPSLYINPFYVLSLYLVKDVKKLGIPDLHKLLSVSYVSALGSGWQVYNVKKAVEEWLEGSSENHGFLLSAESVHGDRVPIRISRRASSSLTSENKQPILVLFNHDSRTAAETPTGATTPNTRKKVKKPQTFSTEEPNDNELYTYETTTPLSSLEDPRFHHSLRFQDSIRHPNSARRFRSRRSRNETSSSSNSSSHSSNNFTECGVHDLFVSFSEIGWTSWIISPKGYNAHYCDGPCVFPLGKEARSTNHATVQSIINQLNLNPGLTRPCCVPTTLLPISLLYYDDQDNVVLKQYVDMVAESCGCH